MSVGLLQHHRMAGLEEMGSLGAQHIFMELPPPSVPGPGLGVGSTMVTRGKKYKTCPCGSHSPVGRVGTSY